MTAGICSSHISDIKIPVEIEMRRSVGFSGDVTFDLVHVRRELGGRRLRELKITTSVLPLPRCMTVMRTPDALRKRQAPAVPIFDYSYIAERRE